MKLLDAATLGGLPAIIGASRFAPYLATQGGNQTQALRLYSWNIEASAAFLGAYAALEVGYRNAMHHQLHTVFGRPDWWESAPLSIADRSEINGTINYLSRRKAAWTHGHVIAELKPSFWEGLLVNKYHAALWNVGLSKAFPNYQDRRGPLRERMERLRLLRNRAAHHEPIYARDLLIDHAYMCDLAGYISSELRIWIDSHSRLPSVVAGRLSTVEGCRQSRF